MPVVICLLLVAYNKLALGNFSGVNGRTIHSILSYGLLSESTPIGPFSGPFTASFLSGYKSTANQLDKYRNGNFVSLTLTFRVGMRTEIITMYLLPVTSPPVLSLKESRSQDGPEGGDAHHRSQRAWFTCFPP